ncbi:dynein light chain 1, cytoplasmic-like [Actinidia eriantha]|uniref:dynein light chain 1, cytoplasmic-like n=1 Tax=Actinidia eriantha TaxID=165200 RepID=UPI00258BCC9D|nr:dynein light chain 1, cytoplasmic-like [Actinidia eriantha]
MLEGKGLVEDTDMPLKMQIQAMAAASQALDLYDVLDCKSIAAHIKKEFDKRYGNGWQCVVGSNFGCFFTHTKGTFIYFTLETLNFLIFKGASSPSSPLESRAWCLVVEKVRESGERKLQRALSPKSASLLLGSIFSCFFLAVFELKYVERMAREGHSHGQ